MLIRKIYLISATENTEFEVRTSCREHMIHIVSVAFLRTVTNSLSDPVLHTETLAPLRVAFLRAEVVRSVDKHALIGGISVGRASGGA